MIKKYFSIKSILYIFCSLCFLATGFFIFDYKNIEVASASVEVQNIDELDSQTLETYKFFERREFYSNGEENTEGLIKQNIFSYNSSENNSITLSFALNPNENDTASPYHYCYYPDPNNRNSFMFFSNIQYELYVNGQDILKEENNTGKNFADGDSSFEEYPTLTVQTFNMKLNSSGAENNEISIMTGRRVREGLYQLKIKFSLVTCSYTTNQEITAEEDEGRELSYYFYVVDNSSYFNGNALPNVANNNFDKTLNITQPGYSSSYYLYSNYSAKDFTNKVPYVEYDQDRYDVSVDKILGNETFTTATLLYDPETEYAAETDPANIISYRKVGNKTRIYFKDVGNYTINLNAIKVVEEEGSKTKYALNGISQKSKMVNVYMFGFQMSYTDIDAEPDENGVQPKGELKDIDYKDKGGETNEAIFIQNADITSDFLSSNEGFNQNTSTQSAGDESFLTSNILNYINSNYYEKGLENKPIIKTNQTPIEVTANANILEDFSYIYSTVEMTGSMSVSSWKLGGKQLYRTNFTGRPNDRDGIYIYMIAYTFDNYREDPALYNADIRFYQLFFFEIDKSLPEIETISKGVNLQNMQATNENVTVSYSTTANAYNKDVTVQIYAQDWEGNYLTTFNGKMGKSLSELSADPTNLTADLSDEAKYTIRLYNSHLLKTTSTSIDNDFDAARERIFIIDKTPVRDIQKHNVVANPRYHNYSVVSNVENFSTNQDIVLSWREKDSGIRSFANYRKFLLNTQNLYSLTDATKRSALIQAMYNYGMVTNKILDMSTTNSNWKEYKGNTRKLTEITGDYILSEAALYLIDVYDEAGNHTFDVVMKDDSTPLFALKGSNNWDLAEPTNYIKESSTLFWGKSKNIYMTNFNSTPFTTVADQDSVIEGLIKDLQQSDYNLYQTKEDALNSKDGQVNISIGIYNALKNLYNHYMQNINIQDIAIDMNDGVAVSDYSGMYITIPISEIIYFRDSSDEHLLWSREQNTNYQKNIEVGDSTNNFYILIRDESNTKVIENGDELQNYTNYYSAKTTVIVSFDDSEFRITYTDASKEQVPLTSNYTDKTTDPESGKTTSTIIYLSPTKMDELFTLSFRPNPTSSETENKVQVEKVTMKYYQFEPVCDDGHYYYNINSDAEVDEQILYKYENTVDEETETIELNPDISTNLTQPGKYILTRTYKIDEGYSYSGKDSYQLTYVFIVDRNEVMTNAEKYSGSDDDSDHQESFVGGDVFVSVFDNGRDASLVVTFPDSENNNSKGRSLYNNYGEDVELIAQDTNKLPVNVYIPAFKYTKYVEKILDDDVYETNERGEIIMDNGRPKIKYESDGQGNQVPVKDPNGSYHFAVENNNPMSYYTTLKDADGKITGYERVIPEYVLYAEISRVTRNSNGQISSKTLIAQTTKEQNSILSVSGGKVSINETAISNGFLIFKNPDGTQFRGITEAGIYHVTLYQGYFGNETGENSFRQSMTFQFQVNQAIPDFQVRLDEDILVSDTQDNKEVYYTNQKQVKLTWEGAADDYEVEIDSAQTSYTTYRDERGILSNKVSTSPERQVSGNKTSYIWTINLDELNIYQNGYWVDITMQFQNHDKAVINGQSLYQKITKRIYVDLEAPSTNIEGLVSKSIPSELSNYLQPSMLRSYKKVDGNDAKNLQETSYNISQKTGEFRYYSYTVTGSYLNTLLNTSDVYRAYAREMPYKYDEENHPQDQETDYGNFAASKFTELSSSFAFANDTYYEIVERDKAGNMAIYTIYVVSYQETLEQGQISSPIIKYNYNDTAGNLVTNGSYSRQDWQQARSAGALHNIYSRTGFTITDINYFGDNWSYIKVNGVNSSNTTISLMVMKTPYRSGLLLINPDGTFDEIDYSNILDGSFNFTRKATLNIYNRENATSDTFYVFVRNTMSLEYNLALDQTSEYIEFHNYPNDASINSTTNGSVYLTSLSISVYNGTTQNVYSAENKSGLSSGWTSSNPLIQITNSGTLKFDITALQLSPSDIVTYTFTDNFNKEYREIHYFSEPVILNEVTTANTPLYSYYDENGNVVYITNDKLRINFNDRKYSLDVYLNSERQTLTNPDSLKFTFTSTTANGIRTYEFSYNERSFTASTDAGYNLNFEIRFNRLDIAAGESTYIRSVFFKLYNQLPDTVNRIEISESRNTFAIKNARGDDITSAIINGLGMNNYYSEISIQFNSQVTEIPVYYSISRDRVSWQRITSGQRIRATSDEMETWYLKVWYDETFRRNLSGSPEYVFGGDESRAYTYAFNLSALRSNFWVVRTINGVESLVQKSENSYTSPASGENFGSRYAGTYATHYIVNINYSSQYNPVDIKLNQEQNLDKTRIEVFDNGSGVYSELWRIYTTTDDSFEAYVVISFVPNTDRIVERFHATNSENDLDRETNLVERSSLSVVVAKKDEFANFDSITLEWSKWYGFKENEIQIHVVKDGITLTPTVFSRKVRLNGAERDYNYAILSYSGRYSITFTDIAGNTQRFNINNQADRPQEFVLTFLKDVPFTVTYTQADGTQSTPAILINQQVFNSAVTLHLDPSTRGQYYMSNAVNIAVERNGIAYTDEAFTDTTNDFSFTTPGFYKVTFSARSLTSEVDEIREQSYYFTIINPNEYKIAYVFNKYSNYYVEKVVRDGEDITDRLLQTMDIQTIKGQDGKEYLSSLPLSFLDEKTGLGRYEITINTNNSLMQDMLTRFTFIVTIHASQETTPISISVSEGANTSKRITVVFNQKNIFDQLGECSFRIIRENSNGTYSVMISSQLDITSESEGEFTSTITDTGTFYIQFVTPSEYLLFSYKVIRHSPMNAAAIIAIVGSVILLVAIIFIIIKLRKRIAVK